MAHEFPFRPTRTYKTEDNARKAAKELPGTAECRFMVVEKEGRFAPVFFGQEAVLMAGHIAQSGFTIVA